MKKTGERLLSTIAAVILAVLASAECTKGLAPEEAASVESMPTATMLFCTYSSKVGTRPHPLPPEYETEFAEIVIAVDNPTAEIEDVSVLSATLLDASGIPTASLRRVDHLVVLPQPATPGPSLDVFAVYRNPEGTPFDGTLPTGRTYLRVRFSGDREPLAGRPVRCLLDAGIGSSPLVVEGNVDGAWM